ncbi:SusC/RagA family TonB-linked outer membrane protein, partial [Agriterribacter sp.]|uniref:SusC/RagA family TonB-linked outer membrane protein n=1 Tax=Agriterribacter sp. TaxID=2821509 RepID=UPI002CE67B1B
DYDALDASQQSNPDVALNKVLSAAGLRFEKIKDVYVIKQAKQKRTEQNFAIPAAVITTAAEFADFAVRGKVTDENGALSGVTVAEKGTSNATITDNNGNFSINVANASAVLVFTYVGYNTMEIALSGRSQVNAALTPVSKELEGVVVTALGITRNKKTLGYSVGEVKSEDLVKAGNINLMKSLDGKVSGVNFTNVSSDPTSSVLVNIRGTTALPTLADRNVALKGQPLYVIDGIPVGTQTVTTKDNVDFGNILSQLNPEDIDNITILKGGSAGALYGKEGGNGVIMITTKSGKGGRKGIGVTYNLSNVWDMPFQFFPVQTEYGPGPRADTWALDGTDTWGPKLDGTTTSDYWNVKTQQWENKAMFSSGENPVKAYLQRGRTTTNNISVQGNYDKGSFRLSLSNMDNKGVMPNTKTNQKSISFNSEYRLTDNVKISVSTSYINTYAPNKARIQGGGDDAVLNTLLYAWPTSLQPLSEMHDYWLKGFEGIRQNGAIMNDNRPDAPDQAGVNLGNPYWWAYENVHRFTRDNFFGKIQLDWKLSRNFSFLLRTGMENVKEYYEQRMSWSDPDNQGKFASGNNNTSLINSDAILTYNNNFGKFSLGASGGANYAYSNNNSMEMTAGRLSAPALFTLNNAAPGTLTNSNPYAPWGTGQSYSVYGTATIGYNNQLFLDVTGRNDWNGVLPEEKINYFYPSASLSWVASETFKLPETINLLKFRIAKADVGNGLLRRRSIDTYRFDASDWGAAKTVSINASLVDRDIKPQHSVTTEGGFDLGMFNNRLHFDFTYFVKKQKDQIDNIPTVQGTGYSGILTNIGDVRNKGFEMGLGITPFKTKNFSWDLSASFTKYKAVITRLSDKFAPNGYVFADYGRNEKVRIAVGEEIGNMYEAEPVLRIKSGKYKGMPLLDGSGGEFQSSGDERDRGRLGNFNPDFILGMNTTLRYKQFSLSLVGSLRYGGKYVSVNQKYMESDGMTQTTISSGPDNPWWSGGRDASQGGHPWPAQGASQYEAINNNNDGQASYTLQDASYAKGVFLNPDYTGDPANASDADYIVNGADPNNTFYQIPTNSYGDVIWNFTSTRTYDATNFKLREISLAYTLPNALLSKYKIQGITLSLIGRNVFQWNKSGRNEDPESAFQGVGTDQGVLRATLPSIRSYGFKLSVGF